MGVEVGVEVGIEVGVGEGRGKYVGTGRVRVEVGVIGWQYWNGVEVCEVKKEHSCQNASIGIHP